MNLRLHIKRLLMATSGLGIVVAAPMPAMADPMMEAVIDEVIVTAQKREENVQQVPIAISVFSSPGRDLNNIKGIEEIAAFTPGVNYSSLDRMSIRGIGRLTNALGSDPGVATYNDGFYNNSLTQAGKSQFFVERVEVLRGPQGTLYGRNSIGGAVNVISKRPSTTLESEVRATAADYSAFKFDGSVSGPLTDKVRYRVAAQTDERRDGYIHNLSGPDVLTVDRRYGEFQLEADVTEHLNVWVKYSNAQWGRDNSDGAGNIVYVDPYFSGSIFPQGFYLPNTGYFTSPSQANLQNPSVNDPFVINQNDRVSNKLDYDHVGVVNVTWDLGSAAVKYIGGWSQFKFALINDYDGTNANGGFSDPLLPVGRQSFPAYVSSFGLNEEYYSNELNITSTGEGPLRWIAGLYQYHEDSSNPYSLKAAGQVELDSPFAIGFDPLLGVTITPVAPLGDRAFIRTTSDLDQDSYAAFGQLDYSFTDHWRGTLGLRYSRDRKAGTESFRAIAWGPPAFIAPVFGPLAPVAAGVLNAGGSIDATPAINARSFEDTWSGGSGRLGAQWLPNENTMVYADYSRGFKSGGFNLGLLGGDAVVEEETVDAFEVGAKVDINQSLQVNSSVFYYLYDDAQLPVTVLQPVVSAQFLNLPEVISYGAEVETVWLPTPQVRLGASYSYLHARVTDSGGAALLNPTTGLTEDVEGNSVPQAPENKVALSGSYRFDFAPGSLTLAGTYIWQDETAYAVFGSDNFVADSFGRADARLIWDSINDKYSVILFGENLADELGTNGATASSVVTGAQRGIGLLQPRSYGIEVQVRF